MSFTHDQTRALHNNQYFVTNGFAEWVAAVFDQNRVYQETHGSINGVTAGTKDWCTKQPILKDKTN